MPSASNVSDIYKDYDSFDGKARLDAGAEIVEAMLLRDEAKRKSS